MLEVGGGGRGGGRDMRRECRRSCAPGERAFAAIEAIRAQQGGGVLELGVGVVDGGISG